MARLYTFVVLCVLVLSTVVRGQIANHIVISECAPGGGSGTAGALYQRDWVELYNPTNSSVDITGWTLQYKSATGTGTYAIGFTFGSVSIAAHSYYLVVSGTAGAAGAVLTPTADGDAGTNLNMSASAGRLALCNNSTQVVAASEASATNIVDFIGWGSTVLYSEGGSPAPAPSISLTLERKAQATSTALTLAAGGAEVSDGNGYDSNVNGADFVAQAAPTPQNSASATETPVSLPVELTSFTAKLNGTSALLSWATATEVNNAGFDVERKAAGASAWTKIGFVAGAGTCNSPKSYSFADRNLTPGVFVYRLKQIDKDGAFTYSATSTIDAGVSPKAFELMNNYPNPFNPATEIRFTVPEDGHATLIVYNALGQEVATLFNGIAQAGHYMTATFNAGRLASGVYVARLQFGGKSIMQRMMLAK